MGRDIAMHLEVQRETLIPSPCGEGFKRKDSCAFKRKKLTHLSLVFRGKKA